MRSEIRSFTDHPTIHPFRRLGVLLVFLLRVGSKITWHSVGKMSSLLGTFADSLCQVIFVRSLILPVCSFNKTDSLPPRSEKGVLDLSSWDFKNDGPVKLSGEWEYYPRKLLSPDEFSSKQPDSKQDYVALPWQVKHFPLKAIRL